eukprot:2366256-Rhodomonas_salina.1
MGSDAATSASMASVRWYPSSSRKMRSGGQVLDLGIRHQQLAVQHAVEVRVRALSTSLQHEQDGPRRVGGVSQVGRRHRPASLHSRARDVPHLHRGHGDRRCERCHPGRRVARRDRHGGGCCRGDRLHRQHGWRGRWEVGHCGPCPIHREERGGRSGVEKLPHPRGSRRGPGDGPRRRCLPQAFRGRVGAPRRVRRAPGDLGFLVPLLHRPPCRLLTLP